MNGTRRFFLLALSVFLLLVGAALGQPFEPGGSVPATGVSKPLVAAQEKAAIIHLDAEVDDMMFYSLKRRVELSQRAGCSLLVFEIDTYGGSVKTAMEISEYIRDLRTRKIVTVAWINHKAYSAGSMIAAACQHVVMAPQSWYGLCAPLYVERTLTGERVVPMPPAERAKANDPILREFDESARQNGWNPTLLHAFVVLEIEVHKMRNDRINETRYVDAPARDALLKEEAVLPGGAREHPWHELLPVVDDDKSLLLVTPEQALDMSLSSGTIADETQLQAAFAVRQPFLRLEFNWAERATVFLTGWMVRLFLFVGMLVFAWLEFSHPGMSVFGIAALLCLVLLVGAPFLTGLAQAWEIVIIVLGLAIIIADLLIFGGLGMLAVPGFLLMAIGLVASFIPSDPTGFMSTQSAWQAAEKGLAVLVIGSFMAAGSFFLFARYLHLTPGFNRLQLTPGGRRGAVAVAIAGTDAVHDAADRAAGDAVFIGAIGIADSDLRPSGKARFGEHVVGVVSYGAFIGQGAAVEVIEVSGMRVVVKPHVAAQLA